jgi:hypothetical protein
MMPGNASSFSVDGLDQLGLRAIGPFPFRIGFEADEELHVEEAGRVRAVVGPAVL